MAHTIVHYALFFCENAGEERILCVINNCVVKYKMPLMKLQLNTSYTFVCHRVERG